MDLKHWARTKSAVSLRGWAFLCFCGMISFQARGLNPDIKISQYGHTAWRLGQAGLGGTPTAIAQTTDGYIWVGTTDGLYRFDGVVFTRWTSQYGQKLPNQDIYSLLGARDGSLYVGTGGGLARLTKGHLYAYPGGLINIRPLIEDQQGTIWMGQRGDEGGLHVLCRVEDKAITCLGNKDGFEVMGGYSIFSDERGSVWVGNLQGIDHWRQDASPQTYPFVASRTNHSTNMYVTSFAADERGSLWAGLAGAGPGRGLLKFNRGEWKTYVTANVDGSKLSVRHLVSDQDGTLWIGTIANGLYKLHNDSLDHFDISNGLTGDAVNGIFKDKEGDLWVLTDGGLDIFRDLAVVPFSTREGISDESVQTVDIAPNNDVWIGTRHALNIMHDQRISFLTLGHGLPTDSVAVIYRDSRNTMWIADQTGRLFYYRDGHFTSVSTEKDGTNYFAAYDITEDNKGEIWLIGLDPTRRKNVLLRVDGTHVAERVATPEGQITVAAPHPQKGLWVGGFARGLFWLHDGQFDPVDPEHFTEGVFRLKAEPGGVLWIFTARHNIFRYQNGRMQRLASQNGMPCDTGYQVVDDHAGSHWLYMSCGIVSVRDEELRHLWQNSAYSMRAVVFDITNGFRTGIGTLAATRPVIAPDGRIWSATGRVAQVIDTRHLPWNALPPPVHVERVLVDHAEQPFEGHIKTIAHPREIEIDYAAMSYVVPDKVKFRYRLEGHDRDWTEAGLRRQAFYNDLKPGKYHFQVIACNNSGLYNMTGDSFDLTVAPAWFQRTWFLLLCITATLFLVYGGYWLRVRQVRGALRLRYEAQLAERTRLARDLHDTLLQTIQGSQIIAEVALEERGGPAKLHSALEKIAYWLNRAVIEGRDALTSLRSYSDRGELIDRLRRAAEQCSLDRKVALQFKVEGKPVDLKPEVSEEIYTIGYEAIRNACAHSKGSLLEVELVFQKGLTLRVRDNGVGLDAETANSGTPGHFGIHGMRERAARLGATFTVHSSPGNGTTITLNAKSIASLFKLDTMVRNG